MYADLNPYRRGRETVSDRLPDQGKTVQSSSEKEVTGHKAQNTKKCKCKEEQIYNCIKFKSN